MDWKEVSEVVHWTIGSNQQTASMAPPCAGSRSQFHPSASAPNPPQESFDVSNEQLFPMASSEVIHMQDSGLASGIRGNCFCFIKRSRHVRDTNRIRLSSRCDTI